MTIRDIFETMDYGPAPESAAEAQAWLATARPAASATGSTGPSRAGRDLRDPEPRHGQGAGAVTQAPPPTWTRPWPPPAAAQPKWARLPGHARARVLYALARLVQKHARLFAVLETMDNGKPIREPRHRRAAGRAALLLPRRHGAASGRRTARPRAPLGVCGADHPVELPAADAGLEGRAGARRRATRWC
jgi:aldehyde dehydrogenase (NAD+)